MSKSFAAIFDWDGVVVDSSAAHERSWQLLASEENLPLAEGSFKRGFGRKNEYIIPHILGWTSGENYPEIVRLGARKEQLYREIVSEFGLEPLPGVRELLEGLRQENIPSAVGSSTHRANIDLGIKLLRLDGLFSGIVTSEDVREGKPAPEVFLKAAASVGCEPGCGVVFEDAVVGVKAALAGGFKVVAVATTNPEPVLVAAGAHRVVHRLTRVSAFDVRTLFAGEEVK
ncbi:MAG: HAD family phosphatase [Puniceicoccales bacterium]|jgi:HAD superfamily hydrolase (TIGR01509 family)|nr:HAD family phosphatase [Puniceicoccales bacterium]